MIVEYQRGNQDDEANEDQEGDDDEVKNDKGKDDWDMLTKMKKTLERSE